MRIDLPYCGFKNCRHCFDGNCTKPSEQGKCEYWYLLYEEPCEPERKKGKWIDTGSGQECSECHEIQYGYDSFRHFCAFCGADMREDT